MEKQLINKLDLNLTISSNASDENSSINNHVGSSEYSPPMNSISRLAKKNKYTKWSKSEDSKLKEIVSTMRSKNWEKISTYFVDKCPKQCIYRWYKVINPSQKKNDWTDEEDSFIRDFVDQYGFKNWTICSKLMRTGKTPNSCKERWFNKLCGNFKSNNFFSAKDELAIMLLVKCMGTSWSKIVKFFPSRTENQIKNKCYSVLRKYCNNDENDNNNESVNSSNCNSNYNSNKIKKSTEDFLNYLPNVIIDMRKKLGENVYQSVCKQYFTTATATASDREQERKFEQCNNSIPCSQMTTLNICNYCRGKIKENIKKHVLTGFMKRCLSGEINGESQNKRIMPNINVNLSSLNSNNSIKANTSSNVKGNQINSINSQVFNIGKNMINTSSKIQAISAIIKKFLPQSQ